MDEANEEGNKVKEAGTKPRKRNKIPVRKRFKHVKRHVRSLADSLPKESEPSSVPSAKAEVENFLEIEVDTTEEQTIPSGFPTPTPLTVNTSCGPTGSWAVDHDYAIGSPSSSLDIPSPMSTSRPGSSMSGISANLSISVDLSEHDYLVSDISSDHNMFSPTSQSPSSPLPIASTPQKKSELKPQDNVAATNIRILLLEVRDKLILMLPDQFVPCVDSNGIHVLMTGRRETKAVQRQIFVSPSGSVRLQVHNEDIPAHAVLDGVREQKSLTAETIGHFADRIVDIVSKLRILEICAGMDQIEFKEAWSVTPQGLAVTDVFKECRYRETFRSKQCSFLVQAKNWRCKECSKMKQYLSRKIQALKCEEPSKFTNTRYLVDKQKDNRLASKQKTIKVQRQTIDRMQSKMKELIARDGVRVNKDMSKDFQELLQSANLSQTQSLFLQQQLKAINCKKSCGMRWHPTLIRMALSIYLKAPGAYKDLCKSGFLKLPSSRTLFDYSHVTKVEPGVDKSTVEVVAKRAEANEEKLKHKQYHVMMADEMHLSKNLVLLKSTGELIGFKDLDELDKEISALEAHLDDPDKVIEPQLATKVMAYMVKGVSSNLKHVVASYPVVNPSAKQLYYWTWDVIGALERSGVRVIAFVCDGDPSNRAFIELHQPATVTQSGAIFDTLNKFAPHRRLYFVSDVPHLLKTMRNAFFNSRRRKKDNKKSTRLLKKNGELIVWDSIIRLYLAKKDQTLRKSYKLNPQNVFPDSFSRMKVGPAAQVWSRTVGYDLPSQGWAGTTETVQLIFNVNDWFDLLNGAFSSHGKRKNNRRLDPYTMKDVEDFDNNVEGNRFQELMDFLKYLNDWKEEVEAKGNASLAMSFNDSMNLGVQPLDDGSFHALNDSQTEEDEHVEHFSRHLFPHQTLLGIEMSVKAFIGATSFLLREGVSFINARVFCQDALEQNFGRHRMGGGGSQTPNFNQFLHKQRAFSTIGELSADRGTGNTEFVKEDHDISSEPLAKRKRKC